LSSAVLLFLARILLLVLLYLFIFMVVQALRHDLRVATRRKSAAAVPHGVPGDHLSLELVDAGQTPLVPGQHFPLHTPFVIGRAARSDIALEDDWISGQHVRLRRSKGDWLAEDLGSTNGTRINDRPIKGAVRIRPGDILDLGRVRFKLVDQP
jgi:hypothetical protein